MARMAQDALVCWSRALRGLMHAGFVVAYNRAISLIFSAGTQGAGS